MCKNVKFTSSQVLCIPLLIRWVKGVVLIDILKDAQALIVVPSPHSPNLIAQICFQRNYLW